MPSGRRPPPAVSPRRAVALLGVRARALLGAAQRLPRDHRERLTQDLEALRHKVEAARLKLELLEHATQTARRASLAAFRHAYHDAMRSCRLVEGRMTAAASPSRRGR